MSEAEDYLSFMAGAIRLSARNSKSAGVIVFEFARVYFKNTTASVSAKALRGLVCRMTH